MAQRVYELDYDYAYSMINSFKRNSKLKLEEIISLLRNASYSNDRATTVPSAISIITNRINNIMDELEKACTSASNHMDNILNFENSDASRVPANNSNSIFDNV